MPAYPGCAGKKAIKQVSVSLSVVAYMWNVALASKIFDVAVVIDDVSRQCQCQCRDDNARSCCSLLLDIVRCLTRILSTSSPLMFWRVVCTWHCLVVDCWTRRTNERMCSDLGLVQIVLTKLNCQFSYRFNSVAKMWTALYGQSDQTVCWWSTVHCWRHFTAW